jgi:hypothetical protein
MIRLLELPDLKTQLSYKRLNFKRHEVDTGLGHGSTIGNVSGPEVHLREL